MFSLAGKVAVVTGGAAGIGRGIVESLREAGAEVVIADLNVEGAQKTAEEVGASAIKLDVTNREQVREAFARVVADHGSLDIVASNAGVYPQSSLDEMTDEDWDKMLTINTKSVFVVTQEALPIMRKQGGGRIVITTSITGSHTGFPGWSHYGASKAAQQGFMRSAALEIARDNITINGVLPGNVLTEGLKAQGEEYVADAAQSVPMLRLGYPRDIGNAVAFLATDEASYITGQTIIVDGGQLLPESPAGVLPARD